jgi:hypothetical protein
MDHGRVAKVVECDYRTFYLRIFPMFESRPLVMIVELRPTEKQVE